MSFILSSLCLEGCASAKADATPMRKVGFYFDTVITLTAYSSDFVSEDSPFFTRNADAEKSCNEFLDSCLELCSKYEKLFSSTIEKSDISKINRAQGASCEVSPETAYLICKALYYAEISEGAFDPTIGSVSSLWNFHADSDKKVPSDEELKNALSHVDYRNVTVTRCVSSEKCAVLRPQDFSDILESEEEFCDASYTYSIALKDPEARLDLGGIAKGYIADKLKAYYKENNVNSGIINLGGNVLLVGSNPAAAGSNTNYNVGIQKPFGEDQEPITTLSLSDKSVVTSGIYDRYFETDGVIYHHLLDSSTGYPIQNNIYSATIVSEKSVDGDALSTICFSLGMEKGMELIARIPDVSVMYVTDKYEIVHSDNFPDISD